MTELARNAMGNPAIQLDKAHTPDLALRKMTRRRFLLGLTVGAGAAIVAQRVPEMRREPQKEAQLQHVMRIFNPEQHGAKIVHEFTQSTNTFLPHHQGSPFLPPDERPSRSHGSVVRMPDGREMVVLDYNREDVVKLFNDGAHSMLIAAKGVASLDEIRGLDDLEKIREHSTHIRLSKQQVVELLNAQDHGKLTFVLINQQLKEGGFDNVFVVPYKEPRTLFNEARFPKQEIVGTLGGLMVVESSGDWIQIH